MSDTSDIDSTIARHKETLRKIEQSKRVLQGQNTTTSLSLHERFSRHWQKYSQTWSTVVFTGSILVLSLRLLNLRREFEEVQDRLERENGVLQKDNENLKSTVENVESSWGQIVQELRQDRWTSMKTIERVEAIITTTKEQKMESKNSIVKEPQIPKRKGFLI